MEWLGPSLSALGLAGAFAFFRWMSRSKAAEVAARYNPQELQARWGRFATLESLIGIVLVLGGGGGGTVLLGMGLHAWAEGVHAARPGFVHHHAFAWYYWAIAGAPFVMLVLVAGGVGVYKLILGARFEEYRAFGILRYGYDTLKVASIMVAALVPLGAAMLVLGIDAYAGATDAEIVIDGYFGFEERRYGFDRVTAMRERVEIKKKGVDRSYAIEFDDGTRWTSEQVSVEGEEPPPFVAYVSERSGRAIVREERAPAD